jgi:hypothetical protein
MYCGNNSEHRLSLTENNDIFLIITSFNRLTMVSAGLHRAVTLIGADLDVLVRFGIVHGNQMMVGSNPMKVRISIGKQSTLAISRDDDREDEVLTSLLVTFCRATLQCLVAYVQARKPIVRSGQSSFPRSHSR